MNPVVVMHGVCVQQSWHDVAPGDIHLKASPSGYINKNIIFDFGRAFVQYTRINQQMIGPILLLLDGHYSHLFNWGFLKLMKASNTIALASPPHTSQALQPLDRGPFHSLKSWWNKELYTKVRSVGGRKLAREEWFQVFSPAYKRAMTVKNIQGGFRVTGMYPPPNHAVALQGISEDQFDSLINVASDSKHFTLGTQTDW